MQGAHVQYSKQSVRVGINTTVQHFALYKTLNCTVVQSVSSEQEMDYHMFHMSTSWSEDLVSCQFLSDLRTSNISNCKQK